MYLFTVVGIPIESFNTENLITIVLWKTDTIHFRKHFKITISRWEVDRFLPGSAFFRFLGDMSCYL